MIISHKYRFIFIKTYKVAGTSVEVYLSQFAGPDDVFTPIYPEVEGHSARNHQGIFNPIPESVTHNMLGRRRTFSDFRRRNKFWNHIPACVVKSRVSKRVWDDYFKFCIERNPWDKTLSDFYMRKQRSGGELTFDDYMKRGRYPINYPRYTDGVNHENVIVDHVMRYENLNEELSNIFGRLGIPFQGSLDVRAKSGHRKDRSPYQEFFVGEYQEYRDAIARAFEREIEIHGYSFD